MKYELIYRFFTSQTKHLSQKQLMFILAVMVGIFSSLAAFLLKTIIKWIKIGLTSWFDVDSGSLLYLIYPAVGIFLSLIFVRYFIRDNISHGITRILYAISRRESRIKPHNCFSSIIGSSTTIGFGGSVGAEAPIVLTGAAIGSNIGQMLRLNYQSITLLLGCGAAGAIAGIFKAPIAGLAFVIEVLMLEMTVFSVVPLLISGVTATCITYMLQGYDPYFSYGIYYAFDVKNIPFYAILGVFCALLSLYFTVMSIRVEGFFSKIKNVYKRWIIGSISFGVLLYFIPPLYGEGFGVITDLLQGNASKMFDNSLFFAFSNEFWAIIIFTAVIIIFKVIAMALTNAAGGVGGIFAPSLFVGGLAGFFVARVLNHSFGMDLPETNFTLVGMAGLMAGVMNAPLMSIFLIAELTGGFGLFIPLMLTCAISYAVSAYFKPYSVYTKRLAQAGDLMTHNKDHNVLLIMMLDKLIERDFARLTPDMTLGEFVKIVADNKRNLFPVVSEEGHLIGIVTLDDVRSDMFNADMYASKRVSDYMSLPPDRVIIDEEMQSVIEKFEQTRAWNLPVVDRNAVYVGFVSKSKILSAYREYLVELSHE